MSTPTRRRDARLNRAQILSAALRELQANPDASIDEIAHAAGVVRRTVYGHFSSREALLEALVEIAAEDIARVAADSRLSEGDPALALARFTLAAWELRERYRALTAFANRAARRRALQQRLGGVRQQVAALIERGQQEGRFTADIPPLALTYMLESLLLGAIEAVADEAIDPDAGGHAATIATLRAAGVPAGRAPRIVAQAARATHPASNT